MKSIRVQYTVKADFAEQNQKNISAVMEELRALGNTKIQYASFRLDDGKTFMHLVHYNSDEEEVTSLPSSLASFKHFQAELKENLEVPPEAKNFELVDASFDMF